MLFCNKCGYQMNEGDRFCFNCGAPYEASPVEPAPVHVEEISAGAEDAQPAQQPDFDIPAPTMFLNEQQPEDTEEVTGELHPVLQDKTYAVLRYLEDGSQKEYKMDDIIINIGRDAESCDVVITSDKFVGRSHALVFVKKGKFYIADLNSKNGTFVNSERVLGLRALDGECEIKIANTAIKFQPADLEA